MIDRAKVDASQRFTASHPCPVCQGHEGLPRGRGERCTGFESEDGSAAFCSRVESENSIETAAGMVWVHRLGQFGRPAQIDRPRPKPPTNGKPKGRGHRTPQEAARSLVRWMKTDKGIDFGELVGSWTYHDRDGRAVMVVFRFDRIDGETGERSKTYRPFHRGADDRWRSGDPEGLLVLYHLLEVIKADLVFFAEGEKAADAIRSLGLVATTTAHGAQSPRRSDLTPLAGKTVVAWPDNDEPGQAYKDQLVEQFSKLDPPPIVKVITPPGLPPGGDAVEWVEAGGTREQLLALVEAAEPKVSPVEDIPEPKPERGVECGQEDDPHRLASLLLDRRYRGRDDRALELRSYLGEFHAWDRGAYREIGEKEVNAEIVWAAKEEFDRIFARDRAYPPEDARGKPRPPKLHKTSTGLTGNVNQALASLTLVRKRDAPNLPAWLCDTPPCPAESVLPCRNALIDLHAFARDGSGIYPTTPEFFNSFALDYDFDPAAPEPVEWLKLLGSLWQDDQESIDALQEWFGLNLVPETRYQKILALIGPKRSGKGTLARILRLLMGVENVAGPTLSGLATNFGLSPLIGKPAAIISDARLSGRADQAVIVERLLSISGEDALTIDRKHREPWTGKLPTRFTLISNELPRLGDSSGAMASRFLILPLTRSFYGVEDTGLLDRLIPELPGILLWAIEGWKRLDERGHFVQPASGKELVEELDELSSPIGAFIKECCQVAPGLQVEVKDLFEAWKSWCQQQNRLVFGNQASFGRDLRSALPSLKTGQIRRGGGRVRVFEGIDTSPALDPAF